MQLCNMLHAHAPAQVGRGAALPAAAAQGAAGVAGQHGAAEFGAGGRTVVVRPRQRRQRHKPRRPHPALLRQVAAFVAHGPERGEP